MKAMSNSVPHNYFNKLHERILSRIDGLEDDLLQSAPNLSRISKTGFFSVPENYFEKLQSINYKVKSTSRLISYSYQQLLVAAGFALLLTFVWVIGDQDKVQSNTLAETEVFDYYLSNIEEVNGELLLDFEALNSFENNISLAEFEEYEIENYLENIVDELSIDDLLIIDELNNDLIE